MDHHKLKSHPEPFEAVWGRRKKHEVRVFDRDYKVGDAVTLYEWEPGGRYVDGNPEGNVPPTTPGFTGREVWTIITHITPPGTWGLPEGVGVFSFEEVDRKEAA